MRGHCLGSARSRATWGARSSARAAPGTACAPRASAISASRANPDPETAMRTGEGEGIKASVRDFILRSIALPQLEDDDDLFETGIVNSLFAVQLATFIEKTFAIEVGMEDLDIENFKS